MWVWLIRSELRPDETALRAVPVEYALQAALRARAGLRAHDPRQRQRDRPPPARPEAPARTATRSASRAISSSRPPGYPPQRASWDATLLLDREFRPAQLEGNYRTQAPPTAHLAPVRVQFTADFAHEPRLVSLPLRRRDAGRSAVHARPRGLRRGAAKPGSIDPAWTRQIGAVSASTDAAITARQTRFTLRDVKAEQIDATLVTLTMNGQTWLEIYESPTGQILQVKTLWGTDARLALISPATAPPPSMPPAR